MDVAKVVSVLAKGKQDLPEIYGVGMVSGGRLPLFLAPTTAGTGSEVTPVAIITTGRRQKPVSVRPFCFLMSRFWTRR